MSKADQIAGATTRASSFRGSISRFDNQLLREEIKEEDYISHVSRTLMGTISSLKADKEKLLAQNQRLILLNTEYLECLNAHYCGRFDSIEKVMFPAQVLNDPRLNQLIRSQLKKAADNYKKLQDDHKMLTKHSLVIQKQNSYLKSLLEELNKMKRSLMEVNHSDIYKLVQEVKDIEKQNQTLRQLNNQTSYDLQRLSLDLNKLTSAHDLLLQESVRGKQEVAASKAAINRVQQEIQDKDNRSHRTIHLLQTKCNLFQRHVQQGMGQTLKVKRIAMKYNIEKVQSARKQQHLTATVKLLKGMMNDQQAETPRSRRLSVTTISSKGNKPYVGRRGSVSSALNKSIL